MQKAKQRAKHQMPVDSLAHHLETAAVYYELMATANNRGNPQDAIALDFLNQAKQCREWAAAFDAYDGVGVTSDDADSILIYSEVAQ